MTPLSWSLSLSLSLSPLEARLLELRTVRWFSDCSSLNIVRRFISVATEAATDGGQTCSDSRTSVGSRRADNKTKQRRRSASAWLAGAWLVEVRPALTTRLGVFSFGSPNVSSSKLGLRGGISQASHTHNKSHRHISQAVSNQTVGRSRRDGFRRKTTSAVNDGGSRPEEWRHRRPVALRQFSGSDRVSPSASMDGGVVHVD